MEKKYSLDWMDEGNCINDDEAAEMLTSENSGTRNEAKVRFCNSCPVKTVCLGYSLHQGDYSMHVMGGLDGNQRRALPSVKSNMALIAFKQYKKIQ
ncbi:WhiB family transcriptional regulator [Candidatus Saccharibacteria bacterium]|jgi:hypothetical protein|nr:WhiB family transcriptional regulator [Candidatus Saccharibacteria bacterium]